MDVPQEIDEYMKQTINHTLGLPVPIATLESKLRASEEAQMRFREQYLELGFKLREKDLLIERVRAEASLNAQSIRKFVEENRKLAAECSYLSAQCARWEKECALYDQDREALMEFGNEADERAKEAETRASEVEEELGRVLEELQRYKNEAEAEAETGKVGLSSENTIEEELLESVLDTVIRKDEVTTSAQAFLEANSNYDSYNKLHGMWNHLKPTTQMVISLLAEMKRVEKDKEHLRINLHTAENEARLLSEENNILDEENQRLLKLLKDRKHSASGGKQSLSGTTKGQKRKSITRIISPIDKLDFGDQEIGRCPLSPLLHNSPDKRMHK